LNAVRLGPIAKRRKRQSLADVPSGQDGNTGQNRVNWINNLTSW
jgi:hypothetical protein